MATASKARKSKPAESGQVERVPIKLRKKHGVTATVLLSDGPHGEGWLANIEIDAAGRFDAPPDLGPFPSRDEAHVAGVDRIISTLRSHQLQVMGRARQDVDEALEDLAGYRGTLNGHAPKGLPDVDTLCHSCGWPGDGALDEELAAKCRVCGCTEDHACIDDGPDDAGVPCHWVEPGLCSACAPGPRVVPLDSIEPCPYNPREHFDPIELSNLAESIREHGLIEPLVVRRNPGGATPWQLVAGERRWRAARQAGLAEVPVNVHVLDDRRTMEIALIENLERADLNAVEEARAFARFCKPAADGGGGLTQAELAARIKRDPSVVSNRLRLLDPELPDVWRQRIISQEIPATHVRALLRVKQLPGVLKAMDKMFRERDKAYQFQGWPCSVETWEEVIDDTISEHTKPMTGKVRSDYDYRSVSVFKPTAEQREELGVVEIVTDGKKELLATNVALWKQLQKASEGRRSDAQEAKGEQKRRELSPAELKEKQAEQAKQFRKRLETFSTDWLRYLCSQHLLALVDKTSRLHWADVVPEGVLDALLLTLAVTERFEYRQSSRYGDVRKAVGGTASTWYGSGGMPVALYRSIRDVDNLGRKVLEITAGWMWGKNGPVECFSPEIVAELAKDLSIDLAAAWKREQCGPLSERYWSLHTKDQLAALGKEVGQVIPQTATKSGAVKLLLAHKGPLPKELGGSSAKPKKPR